MFKESKNQLHCTLWLLLYKTVKKINNKKKEIGELNFGINYTLHRLMPCWKYWMLWSMSLWNTQSTHLHYHEPNRFMSPLKPSNEAVNLSTTTELNHRNSTVCERVINNQQYFFAWGCALRLDKEHVAMLWQRQWCIVVGTKFFTLKACLRFKW